MSWILAFLGFASDLAVARAAGRVLVAATA